MQPEYNLLQRRIESELIPVCIKNDIGILAYSPLAAGHLTGSSKVDPPIAIRKVVQDTLLPIAAQHGVTAAAVALAWVFQQPGITAAIAGASSPSQVIQQVKALELELTAQEMEALTTHFAGVPLHPPAAKLKRVARRAKRLLGNTWRKLGR